MRLTFMRLIFIALALFSLTSCAAKIYGVSEQQWAVLSTEERAKAIDHHQEMERLRELRRIEDAKVAAEQEKQRLLDMQIRQAHAEQIYSGERGIRGDLLRVTIRGGELHINGKHRPYKPVSFRIVDGERKTITFHHPKKHHYQTDVVVEYDDGILTFDHNRGHRYEYRYELAYEPKWRHGMRYRNITFNKHSHLRAKNIDIIIDAVALPRH